MRAPWRASLAVLLAGAAIGSSCSGDPPPTPSLSISSRPTRIDDLGESSTVKVTAKQANGMPGTGTVQVSSVAGSLKSGATLSLGADGTAETPFTCAVSNDISCSGRVQLTAEWNGIMTSTRIQVGDAGVPPPIPDAGPDGGLPDGGADGGSSDGGSTDGGPMDGGTTDGGGGDGGTDGGIPDAGRFDAGAGLAVADAGAVYLLGSLSTSPSTTYAFARLTDPSSPLIGFSATINVASAVVAPNGGIYYYDTTGPRVLRMGLDAFEPIAGGSRYPLAPAMNDVTFDTSFCPSSDPAVSNFWARPDTGELVFTCGASGLHFAPDGGALPALDGLAVIAVGEGRSALARDTGVTVVVDQNGMKRNVNGLLHDLSILLGPRQRSVRSDAQGFTVVLGSNGTDVPPCQLWRITYAGVASIIDTYAGLPIGVTSIAACEGRLDSAGTFYTLGVAGSHDVVVRRARALGAADVVYTEEGALPSDFSTHPPTVFTFAESNKSLVTGP